jgi:hypothetical protein
MDPSVFHLDERHRSWFRGTAAMAGCVVVIVAALGFVALPLVTPSGLAKGGTLTLVSGQPAEAAQVFREGVSVRENLGGARYSLTEVRIEGAPTVLLTATQVQTGQTQLLTLGASVNVRHGGHILRLEGIEPSIRPAGVVLEVTDTKSERTFPIRLTPGRPVEDPEGPGVFALERVQANWAGGAGFGARGTIRETEDGPAATFLAFEQRKDFDSLHRSGRYLIRFRAPIEGHRVTIGIHRASNDQRLPVLLALFLVGVVLLVSTRQVSATLVHDRKGDFVKVSSVNEGGAVARLVERLRGGGQQ